MMTYVYRSDKRPETYVYLREQDAFGMLPADLLKALSPLKPALNFDLRPERKLAQADTAKVLANLEQIGYFIQFPPNETTLKYMVGDERDQLV